MRRTFWALPALLLLVLLAPQLPAADADLAGNWRVILLTPDRPTYWLLSFETKDGKLAGKVLAGDEEIPETTLEDLKLTGDKLSFSLKVQEGRAFSFEGSVSKDNPKTIRGSLLLNQLLPVVLEATTWKEIDKFEINKDIIAAGGNDLRFFEAVMDVLAKAGDKKAKPEEVRGWADKVSKAAEPFGLRFQREIALRTAKALVSQEGFGDIALTYARRAEKLLDPKANAKEQMPVLNVLLTALQKNNKTEELKEVEARLEKLDLSVPTTKFPGRKEKTDRVVLVELFTGAECPPCVGADLAFDGLIKSYDPSEMVFLQYHLHIPAPDPLTNEDGETRQTFYGDDVIEGTPTFVVNGKGVRGGGGKSEDAPDLYKSLRNLLDPKVDQNSKAKLKAAAMRKGNTIDITADVTELEDPGSHIKLRLALIEDEVNYTGGNQVRKHHHVVRAFPGGVNGTAVKTKEFKHTASVDVEELKKGLTKYLDDFAKANKETPFPNAQRPMELKNLKVVAFLQNDKTKEVLQAVQVDVKGE